METSRITVLGARLMGHGIAQVSARARANLLGRKSGKSLYNWTKKK